MIVTGTAGWSVPRSVAGRFPGPGTHLARYARLFPAVEINSSFYRPHRQETYARWAASVPAGFRFAVKLPRSITHEQRLRGIRAPLDAFLAEVAGLGDALGPLLVQLPPSLRFDSRAAAGFFDLLRELHAGPVVCEPRHATWFEPQADELLKRQRVGRVAADPAPVPPAARPGGWLGPADNGAGAVVYWRWHGTPRMYWSAYEPAQLQAWADEVQRWSPQADAWCIFDNTAAGAAIENAFDFDKRLGTVRSPPSR
ncbi:DUF72 domain-containing protein [Schlegelella sp. S2-27]|uniref:DUF72 domain-containing protein n=1 Tax=Caldimonas mangrovi TaxID=2944811 RepID=A0ABT0YIH2_9BURK|nr:DUF72 domain-containing protein [Caldimonas mangrovi]MCM5678184.1 DUF72 domain-containing protein [Caldimonas mangrovi]